MAYIPYLISKFSTGLDNEVQPWLLPDDAQEVLYDGFIYRGVWQKRPGYNQFAIGEHGGAPYCESRMVHKLSAVAMTGAIPGSTYTLTATSPVRRGTFVVTGSNPPQVVTDNGLGGFTGDGTGTINYTTGAVSITFTLPTIAASTVTATYDYHPGHPVMMVANFYPTTNIRQMIVADTRYVNRYNPATNRLDDISPAGAYTGTNTNFWSWTNCPPAAGTPRLLFTNNTDGIQAYDGTTVTTYAYTLGGVATLTCLQMFHMKDRLILLRTNEAGTVYPRRIRISGTGANIDVFDVTAPGAGVIDIPDDSWIMGADFNRDDLIIYTQKFVWTLRYTNNDIVPFTLDRLDVSRGSYAPFGVATYLNKTRAMSPLGFIETDGYSVDRYDNRVPDYSFNNIDQDRFEQCFSGFVDEDRDHYLIHPSPGEQLSDRVLVYNYEELNFSVYRMPLSCMGRFIETYDVTWADLSAYATWDEMAERFASWSDFAYTKGLPFSIGGGHHGQIWRLNEGLSDNQVKVRGATVIDADTLEVTTDFNTYAVGDYIFFEELGGMTEINQKQAAITSVTDANVFRVEVETGNLSAYTSGGVVSRVIPFEALTKKFNPFADKAQKVRCGYMYFYVTASDVGTTDAEGDPDKCFIDVEVFVNDIPDVTQVENSSLVTIQHPYRVNCTPDARDAGTKRWYKIYINQVGRFVQFRVKNTQALSQIQIHAIMPGFDGVGRLI